MKTDISLQGIGDGISKFLHRFHIVLFTVFIVGSMAAMIFTVNQTISRSTDTTEQQESEAATGFDQNTIEQLDQLENQSTGGSIPLPANERTNPFVEP